jgi:DNA recombination protein RmuC
MRTHAKQLGHKKYWEQFDQAPDFVVMFVPGEHFLSAAMEQDPTLWDYAFEHRILIASPINLIALARSVAHVWRESQMADTAREIADLARDLYRRLAKMGERVQKMGNALDNTVKSYNDFVGTLETSVLPQARKFKELGVEGAEDQIARVEPIDRAARLPAPNRDLHLAVPTSVSAAS